jgi:biopolymer transport protein ExbB
MILKNRSVLFRVLTLLAFAALPVPAAPAKKVDERPAQLAALKARLVQLQDSLDSEIAGRWEARQRYLGRRETDKDDAARLRELQERAYVELSRVKEDGASRERLIEQEQTELERRKDESRFASGAVEEILDKQADAVLDAFPPDYEDRRLAIEQVRRDFNNKTGLINAVEALVGYKIRGINDGRRLSLGKKNIVVRSGSAQQVTLARFGHVFAYAYGTDNALYFIRQTGQTGRQRFSIDSIGRQVFTERLQSLFPKWIETGKLTGDIPLDVLQNVQSQVLSSGERKRLSSRAWKFIHDGGPVMIPLLLLPVWALLLVILKLLQFRKKIDIRRAAEVIACIEKGDMDRARKEVDVMTGVTGDILAVCVTCAGKERQTAEKAVKEILSEEAMRLNRHLNTIAVIAGVAPLLGLLGTVTGMINLFDVITSYGTGDPKMMAAGISEALITTETGLVIAIPLLLIHNYLRNRKNRILSGFERQSITAINRIWPR